MRLRSSSIMDDTEFEERPNSKRDTQCLTFTDEPLAGSVLAGMDTLRQAGQLCDCVLRVGKKLAEFTAHQAVLASVSPYFMAMFEQDPRNEVRKSYNVKETTPEVFEILLEYAYSGKLNMDSGLVCDVYRAATTLKFNNVAAICSTYLMESLHPSNCLDVRRFVSDDPDLVERTNQFIQENMTPLREHKSFLSLPQINIKLLGESRGLYSGPDASTIAKLISDWLIISTATPTQQQPQEVDAEAAVKEPTAAPAGSLDMQVLLKHSNVLFLDADNHLQDVSSMDESISKSDAVQDYVKVCKKYNNRSRRSSNEFKQDTRTRPVVEVISHDKVNSSLYNVICSLHGEIYNVVVRMQTVEGSTHHSASNSVQGDSSSFSSGEEDDRANGLDQYYPTCSVSSFEPLSDMNHARCGVGLAAWDGNLIAIGGNDRGECLDSAETYSADTNTWSDLPCMSCPRGRFECAVLGDRLYACGGSDGRRELDSVECFDGKKWEPSTRMPHSKSSAGVGVLNNELYVIGGYNGQRAERSCEMYNAANKKWSKIAKLHEGRSQAAVCSHKGLLYVFGGTDSWNCYSSVEMYNPSTNTWCYVSPMSHARRGAAAINYRGKVYVVGGSDGSKSLDSVEIYDPHTNTWALGPSLCTPRSNAGLAVLAGRLYIAGGYGKNKFLSSIEVLDSDDESQWCSFHKHSLHNSHHEDEETNNSGVSLSNGHPHSNGVYTQDTEETEATEASDNGGTQSLCSDSDPDH